jgi:hypothetical protein
MAFSIRNNRKKRNKYIIDIIEHFSKWYYGYLLKTKKQKKHKKIDYFIKNFVEPKILQTDNVKEYKINF